MVSENNFTVLSFSVTVQYLILVVEIPCNADASRKWVNDLVDIIKFFFEIVILLKLGFLALVAHKN